MVLFRISISHVNEFALISSQLQNGQSESLLTFTPLSYAPIPHIYINTIQLKAHMLRPPVH